MFSIVKEGTFVASSLVPNNSNKLVSNALLVAIKSASLVGMYLLPSGFNFLFINLLYNPSIASSIVISPSLIATLIVSKFSVNSSGFNAKLAGSGAVLPGMFLA